MRKVLIIGQAPPLKKQIVPYDSTMLYDWLEGVGLSKDEIIEKCDFEAMTNKKPKVGKRGGHLAPGKKEMEEYYDLILKEKIKNSNKILLLGKCPIKFFGFKEFFLEKNKNGKEFFTLIHPSKRNILLYRNNKNKILNILKKVFI